MNNRLIKSNDAGGGACTNTVDLYNPFPDGGGVALYQLNGDATDVSGNYDGTASNVTYGAGQFGQAGVFNGSSSYISGFPTLTNPTGNSFSVSLWVNTSSTDKTIFGGVVDEPVEYDSIFRIRVNSSGGAFVDYRPSQDPVISTVAINSSASISDGAWHNIVAIVTDSQIKLYLDGSEVGDSPKNITGTTNVTNAVLGALNNRGAIQDYFTGEIDQVRIFSRALRPYEVEALYTEEYCTPTIVPSEHFNTVTYDGTGGSKDITNVGFEPDLTWIKSRGSIFSTDNHNIYDSIRGANYALFSDLTIAENYNTQRLQAFLGNGFTIGDQLNVSGGEYVAWNFKAGGSAVTNTDGTITSQVSANTEAGFSIVTFTGNGTTASVGHGLGQKPSIIFTKNRSVSEGWFTQQYMYVPSGNAAFGYLNTTAAFTGFTDSLTDDTVMQQGGTNGQNYVSYCFAEVEGFSNFGSYVGNGSTSGPTVITGFEPAFLIVKRTQGAGNWLMFDNKRSPSNPLELNLDANNSEAEENNVNYRPSFLENGFSIGGTSAGINANGETYIYMAFAADPTTIEPTLEDSFNTVTYTGTGANQQVTGVGFEPDLVWIKNRDTTNTHTLHDTIRGIGNQLASNTTGAEQDETAYFTGVGDGFLQFGLVGGNYNTSGQDYVAWNWKGAELPAINSNGSIPSVVSANPAAGFSIVSWASTSTTSTIGHGLESTPSIIFMKSRTNTGDWQVYSSEIGASQKLFLNTTSAATSSGVWGNTNPNENVFTSAFNSVGNVIAYCFAEVAGFSKFGSYTGTGASGNAQVLGFEPAFVMAKRTDSASGWLMVDNKRNGTANYELFAHSSDAEYAYDRFLFNANGFEFNSGAFNESGSTWIYMAFANQF